MNEASESVRQAYRMLGAIPVTGDSVELMAAAREHLRRALRTLEKAEKGAADHGG